MKLNGMADSTSVYIPRLVINLRCITECLLQEELVASVHINGRREATNIITMIGISSV